GYAFYTAEQEGANTPGRLLLLSDLRQAAEHEQLLLHYQPKVEILSGGISQVEALIRWQHPQRGLLSPDQFLPLAEEAGLMKVVSNWVLGEAVRQCRLWSQAGIGLCIAVNLSMRDLQDPQIVHKIAGLLEAWSLNPSCLEVEITETAIAEDMGSTYKTLAALH